MSDKDYAPLSVACVRALHDKIVDKRKTAAFEVEKMVKEANARHNHPQIKRIIKVVGDIATCQNSNGRKGGLIALAAVAVALGKDASVYTEDLITPILSCFSDSDLGVRYFASESLYNVIKVVRDAILPHFHYIFNALSKLATDPDHNVKSGSELLDRLMKDIVTENPTFDLVGFIPLLRERIYSRNPFAQQFIISWISLLDAVPYIDLIIFLPELLDGLFRILGDSTIEIKKMCDIVLGEFLRSIKKDPSRVHFAGMINILITNAQSSDELVQFTAITWIKEFVQLSGPLMLPYLSGIFTAVLPCLAYDGELRKNIKETATAVNFSLMKLITMDEEPTSDNAGDEAKQPKLDLASIEVLIQHLAYDSVPTKVAVLKWIHHLYLNIPIEMFEHIEKLFPFLLNTLSDPADEVVQQCLVVIAEIISSSAGNSPSDSTELEKANLEESKNSNMNMNPYYSKFVISLLKSFRINKNLLEDRGSFIIRQLCVLLNAEDIYRTLAQILLQETNLKFVSTVVESLNIILLTSSELFKLRSCLKDLNTKESCELFECLYETWCHNPVATVSLCLLSQNYAHACQLIRVFGTLEVTVEFLIEIDKLVQLIESPIFAFLRLELLEAPCDQNLIRALYGLLMLLPQSEAFHTLRKRLECIPSLHLYYDKEKPVDVKPKRLRDFNFEKMLNHFVEVQEQHKMSRETIRAKNLSMLERDIASLNTGFT